MDKTTLILGILLGAIAMYLILHFLWHVGFYAIATIFSSLGSIRTDGPRISKSLGSMEKMLLPQVRRDLPNFDPDAMKETIRNHLLGLYGDKENFQIPVLALRDYQKQPHKKLLSYEASLCWKEKKELQKRISISVVGEDAPPLSVCPGCGAAVSPEDHCCSGCGQKLPKESAVHWTVSSVKES